MYNTSTHIQLKVLNISDISSDVFNGFVNFCHMRSLPLSYAPSLKSAIKAVALETGKIPLLELPVVSGQRNKPKEPLYDDGYESLCKALMRHIDGLYGSLKLRAAIDSAIPYTYEEVAKIAFRQISKDDFVYWWRTTAHSTASYRRQETIRRLKLCTDSELHNLHNVPKTLERTRALIEHYALPENFISVDSIYYLPHYSEWYPNDARLIKTLVTNGYPMNLSLEDLRGLSGRECEYAENCDTVVKLLLHRIRFAIGRDRCSPLWPLDWFLNDYYPQSINMAAVILFIMLQSGWNQETVLSLNKDNFEHPLTGAINSNHVIVFCEKNRSQGIGKGYPDPEPIFAPSDAENPYSIVSLIRLANELSLPLQGLPFDFVSELTTEENLNQLFLYLRQAVGAD